MIILVGWLKDFSPISPTLFGSLLLSPARILRLNYLTLKNGHVQLEYLIATEEACLHDVCFIGSYLGGR